MQQGIVGSLTFLHRHVPHKHEAPVTFRQRHAEAAETRWEEAGERGFVLPSGGRAAQVQQYNKNPFLFF